MSIASRLNVRWPLVQAPMAGVSTAALAGAASRAGALGSIAIGAMTPDAADVLVAEAMSAAGGLLNVNVFTHPRPIRDPVRESAWLERLTPWFNEFGIEPPAALGEIYRTFDDEPAMLDVLLAHRPPVVSFHFGLPRTEAVRALKAYGACLMATATSVDEARRLADAGIDIIVAQGYEAGGHRGAFGHEGDECLTTFDLVPRIAAGVDAPVLAAGGLSTGADVAAAMALGAAGAQLGTVFIPCPESAANEAYRKALANPHRTTAMTAAFSGRRARGLINRFVRETAAFESEAPAYPIAYDAAKRLAAASGSADFTPLWSGTALPRPEPLPAADLVRILARESEAAG